MQWLIWIVKKVVWINTLIWALVFASHSNVSRKPIKKLV
jgi:hypothetical protein